MPEDVAAYIYVWSRAEPRTVIAARMVRARTYHARRVVEGVAQSNSLCGNRLDWVDELEHIPLAGDFRCCGSCAQRITEYRIRARHVGSIPASQW